MKMLENTFRKISIFFITIFVTGLLLLQPSYSQTTIASNQSMTNYLLSLIVGTTTGILKSVNQIPAYLESITEMAESWISTNDPSNTIGNNQYAFASLNVLQRTGEETQLNATEGLIKQLLLNGSFNSNNPTLPPNANDLTYTILFGRPLIKPSITDINSLTSEKQAYAASLQNYMKNASGSNLTLEAPNPNWKPSSAQKQYVSLYNTLTSMQSYNQYLVAGLANLKERQELFTNLTNQAADPNWFKQISTEPLGLVLRHILMYVSQSFAQSNQLIELQQKQLAATAMTNSLLVILVQANVGGQLQLQAKGTAQTPSVLQ